MSDRQECRFCGLPIELIGDYWVIMGTDTTADGLSYCPPNPDHEGDFVDHEPPCDHEWVAGFMVVHPEDLAAVAKVRKVVCEKCDHRYDPKCDG